MWLIVFIVFCTTVGHDSSPPLKERGLLCPYTPTLLFDLKAIYYPMICRKALTLAYMRGIIVSSGDAARMLQSGGGMSLAEEALTLLASSKLGA